MTEKLNQEALVNGLEHWAPLVVSGYECPAAGVGMQQAADAIRSLSASLAERTRERDEALEEREKAWAAHRSLEARAWKMLERIGAAEARVKELEADIAVRRQDRFDLATKLAAAEARVKALAEAGKGLERAAYEVARYGAQTGARWTKLSSALIQTRAALASSDAAPEKDDALAVLSELSSYVGAGLGDEKTTAAQYSRRIRWGITHHANASIRRCATVVDDLSRRPQTTWGEVKRAILDLMDRPSSDAAPESKEDAPSDDTPPAKEGDHA